MEANYRSSNGFRVNWAGIGREAFAEARHPTRRTSILALDLPP